MTDYAMKVAVTQNKRIAKADKPNNIKESRDRVQKAVNAAKPAAQKGTRTEQSPKAVTRSHATQRAVIQKAAGKIKIPTKQEMPCKINKTRPTEQELDDLPVITTDPKLNISCVRKFWYNDIVYLTPKIARSLMGKKIMY